ncbi:PorV/PorQ family protein [Candidatus Poribacteria bacterium]|nr:PorV/PorQ family protein [Candidatus Poribacteria bacterium]
MGTRVEWRVGAVAVAMTLCFGGVQSASAAAGRTGAAILDLPHRSVRATALGEAFSAYHGDVNTVLWNPSGLYGVDRRQVLGGWNDFANVFGEAGDGLYYALFAGAVPVKDAGVFGATLQLNGQGTIEITTDSPEVLAEESLGTNWVLGLTYADQLAEGVRGGVTGKMIRLPLGTGFEQASTATAYAVDLGAQYDIGAGVPVTIGIAVLNLGTRVQYKDANQSDPLPRKFQTGVAVVAYDSEDIRVVVSGDFVAAIDKLAQDTTDEDFVQTVDLRMTQPKYAGMSREEVETGLKKDRGTGIYAFGWDRMERSVGVEARILKILAVRAGYKIGDPLSEVMELDVADRVSAGFGIDLTELKLPVHLDYANGLWGAGGPFGKRINTFSLSLAF